MALFAVTYDLIERKDYTRLTGELRRIGAAPCALSVWLVDQPNMTTFTLRDWLLKFIDQDDRLVVIEFEKKPAYTRAIKEGADWIAARFA